MQDQLPSAIDAEDTSEHNSGLGNPDSLYAESGRVRRVTMLSQLAAAVRMLFCRSLGGRLSGPGWPAQGGLALACAALAAARCSSASRGGAGRGVVRVRSPPRWLAQATRMPGYCRPRAALCRLPCAC